MASLALNQERVIHSLQKPVKTMRLSDKVLVTPPPCPATGSTTRGLNLISNHGAITEASLFLKDPNAMKYISLKTQV